MPRVSVICPFFNSRQYLAEAVDSVLAQSLQEIELLLVDDGSDDGSSAVASNLARRSPNVRHLEHPRHQNRGTSASRNLGIQFARGQYIAFIDADDRWRPDKLVEQVALLDSMPDTQAVFGAVNYWSSWQGGGDQIYCTGNVRNRTIYPPDAFMKWYPIGTKTAPSMSDIIVRRSVFKCIGGFDEMFTGTYEEHTFLVKLYLKYSSYVSANVWSDYRQHDISSSARLSLEDYTKVRERFFDWLENYIRSSDHADDVHVLMAMNRASRRSPPLKSSTLLTGESRGGVGRR